MKSPSRILHLLAAAGALFFASLASYAEPLEIRARTVWNDRLHLVNVFQGQFYRQRGDLAGTTDSDGNVMIDAQVGDHLVVKAEWSAPRGIEVQPSDLLRGYVNVVLYSGARVSGSINRGGSTGEILVTLRYADPWLVGETLRLRPRREARYAFNDLPMGLARLSLTIEEDDITRRVNRWLQVTRGSIRRFPLVLMEGTAGMRGSVIGPKGTPVRAEVWGGIRTNRVGESFIVQTNEQGQYDVRNIPGGPASFRATLENGLMKRVDVGIVEDEIGSLTIRFDVGPRIDVAIENRPAGYPVDLIVLDDHHAEFNMPSPGHLDIYYDAARAGIRDVSGDSTTIHGLLPGIYTAVAIPRVVDVSGSRRYPAASKPALLTIDDDTPQSITLKFSGTE